METVATTECNTNHSPIKWPVGLQLKLPQPGDGQDAPIGIDVAMWGKADAVASWETLHKLSKSLDVILLRGQLKKKNKKPPKKRYPS